MGRDTSMRIRGDWLTLNDSYWADGGDGSGRNRLGELLMELRSQLAAGPA